METLLSHTRGPWPVPDRLAEEALRGGSDPCPQAAQAGAAWFAARSARAAPSANGAMRKCCAGSGGPASLTSGRRSNRPTRRHARFLASWRESTATARSAVTPARGRNRPAARDPWVPLQGVALTSRYGKTTCWPAGSAPYSPTWLDEAPPAARVVWIRAGAVGPHRRTVALLPGGRAAGPAPPPANAKLTPPEGEVHDAIRERLAAGPAFWLDLANELDRPSEELHSALWDLAFGGEITNDSFAPLRAPRLVGPDLRPAAAASRRRAATGPTVQGRWSLTETLFRNAPRCRPEAAGQAERCWSATAS